mmetsp:Transcript_10911/g.45454  ORF Transcript_10911/g.45454 Transcript_10911/m.45454 type:complete len:81 (+) Transcript_10911:754-996(+)
MLWKVTCFEIDVDKCSFDIFHLFDSILQTFANIVSTSKFHFFFQNDVNFDEKFRPKRVCTDRINTCDLRMVVPGKIGELR